MIVRHPATPTEGSVLRRGSLISSRILDDERTIAIFQFFSIEVLHGSDTVPKRFPTLLFETTEYSPTAGLYIHKTNMEKNIFLPQKSRAGPTNHCKAYFKGTLLA